jgi:hypothetical protein
MKTTSIDLSSDAYCTFSIYAAFGPGVMKNLPECREGISDFSILNRNLVQLRHIFHFSNGVCP